MSLKALKEYLYAHPERVQEILNYNPSYTFFRHIPGDGPLGNIEVPLTPERSIAMDHRLVPKGGLVFYEQICPRRRFHYIRRRYYKGLCSCSGYRGNQRSWKGRYFLGRGTPARKDCRTNERKWQDFPAGSTAQGSIEHRE